MRRFWGVFVLLSVCAVMKGQQNSASNCTSHFGVVRPHDGAISSRARR